MAKIMFDLDGVLRNWNDSWQRIFEAKHGHRPKVKPIYNGPLLALEDAGYADPKKLLFEDWGYEVTANAPPYPQAQQVIHLLKDAGHTVIIVTDQPNSITKAGTLIWLANYLIIPNELYFTEKKHTIEADYYIDDYDRNLFLLALHRPNSTIVRILRPWNEQFDYNGLPIVTIGNLMQYAELINGRHKN